MIQRFEISEIGQFNKSHGIKGELNATMFVDHDFFDDNNYIIVEVNGIFVPFYIETVRTKGSKSMLIKLEDVDSEIATKPFVNKTIFCRKEILSEYEEQFENDGEYADFYIGYAIHSDDNVYIGEIIDIDDSTENALFVVKYLENINYIPITSDFISNIDNDKKILYMMLPEGLINLNS